MTNVFLIFREFDHDPSSAGPAAPAFFLAQHERWVREKWRDCRQHGAADDMLRRPFAHVEMVLDTRQWFGVINQQGGTNRVFLKDKLDYLAHVERVYPQVVQIQVTEKQHAQITQFARKHAGEPFASAPLVWNMAVAKVLPHPPAALLRQAPGQWYCTKLVLQCLAYAGVIPSGALSTLCSTSEDIFRHMLAREGDSIVYVHPYGQSPEGLIPRDGFRPVDAPDI